MMWLQCKKNTKPHAAHNKQAFGHRAGIDNTDQTINLLGIALFLD